MLSPLPASTSTFSYNSRIELQETDTPFPSPILPLQTVDVIGVEHEAIPYFSWSPFNVTGDIPIYLTSNNTSIEDDACKELPADTPDLSKYLVIVRRGTCQFVSLRCATVSTIDIGLTIFV